MSKRLLLGLACLIGFIVLIGLAVGLLVLFPPGPHLSLTELLTMADSFIARSSWAEAGSALDRAVDAAADPDQLLRVLKRSLSLARTQNNFTGVKNLAVRAFRRFPRRPELCRLALYACLRDQDAAQALSLPHDLRAMPEVQALTAEAFLASGREAAREAVPLYARYLVLEHDDDPAHFLAAGRELGDERFFLDAALLQLVQGKAAAADETARRLLLAERFDEAAGLIAYEAGSFEAALPRLEGAAARAPDRADLTLIAGDCGVMAGRRDRAAVLYRRAIEANEALSPAPYCNLAWLLNRQNRDDEALLLLRRALELFPNTARPVSEYARLLFRRGQAEEARRLLDGYVAAAPDDFDARFLRLSFSAEGGSPSRRLQKLEELYFEKPGNERAAFALVSRLFIEQDLAGVRTVLTHYAEVSGTEAKAWMFQARAILEALTGDLRRANLHFNEAIALEDAWEIRHNRALILLETGRLKEAEDDLRQAAILLGSRDDQEAVRGRTLIHARTAAVLALRGDRPGAERELHAAFSLDPTSAEAYRVKRQLEAAPGK